jgi:hypothetical protein
MKLRHGTGCVARCSEVLEVPMCMISIFFPFRFFRSRRVIILVVVIDTKMFLFWWSLEWMKKEFGQAGVELYWKLTSCGGYTCRVNELDGEPDSWSYGDISKGILVRKKDRIRDFTPAEIDKLQKTHNMQQKYKEKSS